LFVQENRAKIRLVLFAKQLSERFWRPIQLMPKKPKQKKSEEALKGWAAIAKFLSQPVSTVQRSANEGMPVNRIGRYVAAVTN